MSAQETVEPLIVRDGERLVLASPAVGLFTCAAAKGRVVAEGEEVGAIRVLGVTLRLVVPPGARGRVANERPERVLAPVQYGETLYELEAAGADAPEAALAEAAPPAASELVVRSPHAGRFWHRAAPGEAPFVVEGGILEDGQPIGLVEVMKTFTRVPYRAVGGLPARARVRRIFVGDGAETEPGQALLEVEPAGDPADLE